MLDLDRAASFDPIHADEFLRALPAAAAVVLIEPRPELPNARPLLLRTANLRRRLGLLLGPPLPESRRVNLRDYAAGIRYRLAGSPFELALAHFQQARRLWPENYRQKLRLRPPALIKMNTASAYPRAYITRRIGPGGLYAGPFLSRRAADAYLESSLDLFRMRRCQIKIRRDPSFPGCIYSEMKMCLAPCFAGCTDQEYAAEAGRVAAFLSSGGASLVEELSRERQQASESLDFERAAGFHKRLEKVEALGRTLPELVRRIDGLDAIVLQRAVEINSIAVFLLRRGLIADPFLLKFSQIASSPRSVEQILRSHIEEGSPIEPAGPATSAEPSESSGSAASAEPSEPSGSAASAEPSSIDREDHLSLLARWFYAKPRAGEIFFGAHEVRPEKSGPGAYGVRQDGAYRMRQEKSATWPYRRILRACSRLLQAAQTQAQT